MQGALQELQLLQYAWGYCKGYNNHWWRVCCWRVDWHVSRVAATQLKVIWLVYLSHKIMTKSHLGEVFWPFFKVVTVDYSLTGLDWLNWPVICSYLQFWNFKFGATVTSGSVAISCGLVQSMLFFQLHWLDLKAPLETHLLGPALTHPSHIMTCHGWKWAAWVLKL